MSMITIKNNGEHELIIEKSRFICYVKRVDSKEAAYEFIKEIKKKHWDATHNCSAFIIGEKQDIQGSSDDGEPSGTAGLPMLEVLRKNNLHDVVAIVTRYFGGIKLGAGGLVRAYSKSISSALAHVGLIEKIPVVTYKISVDINSVGRILNALYQQNFLLIKKVDYGQFAEIFLSFKEQELDNAALYLTDLLSGKLHWEFVDTEYSQQDVNSN